MWRVLQHQHLMAFTEKIKILPHFLYFVTFSVFIYIFYVHLSDHCNFFILNEFYFQVLCSCWRPRANGAAPENGGRGGEYQIRSEDTVFITQTCLVLLGVFGAREHWQSTTIRMCPKPHSCNIFLPVSLSVCLSASGMWSIFVFRLDSEEAWGGGAAVFWHWRVFRLHGKKH